METRLEQRYAGAPAGAALLLVALALTTVFVGVAPSPAHAVQATSLKLTVAPAGAAALAEYSVTGFRAKDETITRYSATFPAGTNVAGARGPNPGDTVIISGQTVTVVLASPIVAPGGNGILIEAVFRNINNPITPGAYNIPSVTFISNGSPQTINLGKSGNYNILTSPYLTLTITTPDAPQTVNFGNVDPGVPVSGSVLIEIDSSGVWTMTRSITGSVAALGFAVTSPAPIGVATAAGFHRYTETYTVNPPWTTTPGMLYTTAVTYTVTQQ